jgi:NCS1 family nucleobase:cation symporter-1
MSTATPPPLFVMEQKTIAAIPEDERHGSSRELFAIWFGMNMTPLTVVTGALATTELHLSLWWAFVAIVLGHAIGGIGMALHSAQGPQLGVPQMLQARGQFGGYGAAIIVVVATVMFVGYFSSNLLVASDSVQGIAPHASSDLMLVLATLFSLAVTAFGYRLVRAVTAWSSYIVGGLVLLAFLTLFVKGDVFSHLSLGGWSNAGFAAMLAIGVVWQLTYAPYVSDYSRYLPRRTGPSGAFWGSYGGCVGSSILLMLLGAVVGLASTETSTMSGLRGLIGTVLGVLVLFGFAVAAASGNSVNAYCSALCLLTLAETFRRGWQPMLRARLVTSLVLHVVGLVIALAAASSFATTYYDFLSILLYVLIPWSAVNLVDYYLVRHANYAVEDFFAPGGGRYGQYNIGALVVFVVGVLAQLPFMETSIYEGPIANALGGVDIAWLVGLVVSGLLYLALARLVPTVVRLAPSQAGIEVQAAAEEGA